MTVRDEIMFEVEIALTQERLAVLKLIGECENLAEFNKLYNQMIRKKDEKTT